MLKGTFQYTEDLDDGKMKIATEPGHSSYLVFDIIKQAIIISNHLTGVIIVNNWLSIKFSVQDRNSFLDRVVDSDRCKWVNLTRASSDDKTLSGSFFSLVGEKYTT